MGRQRRCASSGRGGTRAGAPAGGAAPAAEEKRKFNMVLAEMGANKIAVIKEVRSAVPGLGLRRQKRS